MVKRCMDELEIDPKRFPPRAIRGQISGAKNRLRDVETVREAGWLVYPVLSAGAVKLLAEDLRVGSPAALVASFVLLGGALIVAPRLGRRKTES